MHLVRYSYPIARNLAARGSFATRSPWSGLESEIDQFFQSTLSELATASPKSQFPVDLFEDKESFHVRAELPGVDRKDINVEMVEGFLSIQASRKQKVGDTENSVSFSRSIKLSDEAASDKISALYENGVLSVTLPKKEEAKPRKFSVPVN